MAKRSMIPPSTIILPPFALVSRGGFFGALLREKLAQDGGALLLAYARGDGAVVVEPLVLQEVHRATGGSAFGVRRAEHHAVESAMNDCPGAHWARFFCGVKRAAAESPITDRFFGGGEREHFGVSRGVF